MAEDFSVLNSVEDYADEVDKIPVHISFEIIRLFSEGLYQSPHKAIEELVSNGYDAGASQVHVLLPDSESGDEILPPLWVIDNGSGMNAAGFRLLWQVAYSEKAGMQIGANQRLPIGQFGIGKLAAYVLAWRLTHISRADGKILLTSMNFHDVSGKHQFEGSEPLDLKLLEIDEDEAKRLLADIEVRDPTAWEFMFGEQRAATWTVAGLTDFKNLYDRLSAGILAWVLRTGLPLHSGFGMWLDGQKLHSSKEDIARLFDFAVGGDDDSAADKNDLEKVDGGGVRIPGIDGSVTGTAAIFERKLTRGKSEQYGRSHGFFIRVRGRVINLEDELFGLDALNHAAWSRFAMQIEADGLRDHLLSSREGVRENEATRRLRKYLHAAFNICRNKYEAILERELAGIDIETLLSDAPSLAVTSPIIDLVRKTLESDSESFYISKPQVPDESDSETWLSEYESAISESPFENVDFLDTGPYDRATRYIPDSRTLIINTEHPYVEKLLSNSRDRRSATLFGTSEVLMEALLLDHGNSLLDASEFLSDRDRVLRLLAGEQPSTASEILRYLNLANQNDRALERAVGEAFKALGFEYERRGGRQPGPDGVLYARLGRGSSSLSDYKVVYDAKQTNQPSVPADKIDFSSLDDFRKAENANYGFFVARSYSGEMKQDSKLNRKTRQETSGENGKPITMIKLDHLERVIRLHYRYGVTLTQFETLFQKACTVKEAEEWVRDLEIELSEQSQQVPLRTLLTGIDEAKGDKKARPNINSVRALNDSLKEFSPEKLLAALRAVETIVGKRWLEVETASGDVKLHSHAEQILAEVEKKLLQLFDSGINALNPPMADQ